MKNPSTFALFTLRIIVTAALLGVATAANATDLTAPLAAAEEKYRAGDLDGTLQQLEPLLKAEDLDQTSSQHVRELAARVLQIRGEEHFRQARIAESIADFDRQLQLQPDRAAEHWQRGIAYYYAGEYEKGAKQFELHRTVNPQDVENAAWHFLCAVRAPEGSVEAARKKLIPVTRDVRVPMAQIQLLFAGAMTPEEVLRVGAEAGGTAKFYADLYVGLYYEALGRDEESLRLLKLAADNPAAKDNYMGDVARVHVKLRKAATPPQIPGEQYPIDGVTVFKIWDQAPHNAFTDLVRWHDRFYCAFREGEHHVHGADGKVRVIASDDGETWKSIALLEEPGVDLRDAKLSITPDDRLMILMGGSHYVNRELIKRLPRVAFLNQGSDSSTKLAPVVIDPKVASENDWLWRVRWHDGVGYGVIYQAYYPPSAKKGPRNSDEHPWGFHLVKTTDGVHNDHVATFNLTGMPGEATPLFLEDGRMIMIVRNGKAANLGISSSPYTDWVWKDLPLFLGGPDLIRLPNGTIVLGTRGFEGVWGKSPYTVLGTLSLEGQFVERVRLPSGGDTSYPGMLVHDGQLWASYYSSHEGRAAIYLAKIPLTAFQ